MQTGQHYSNTVEDCQQLVHELEILAIDFAQQPSVLIQFQAAKNHLSEQLETLQTQVPTPTPEPDTGKVRVALHVEEDGNGAKTTFTTGTDVKTHRDPDTGIGSGNATLYFGGVLEGVTPGALTVTYDDVLTMPSGTRTLVSAIPI